MAASAIRSSSVVYGTEPHKYRSADPPLVRQSAAHKALNEELAPWIKLASPSARRAVLDIRRCGRWDGTSWSRRGIPIRYWCKNRTCPSCGRLWRDRTAKKQRSIVEQLLNGQFENARRVTLNFRHVADRDVPFVVHIFRQLLSKFFEKLPSCVLIGGFDFAFDSEETVNAHVHATLIDLAGNIEATVKLLQKEFNEERCFCAQAMSQTLKRGRNGPLAWHSYAMDSSVTAYKHQGASSWTRHSLATVADKLKWIGLYEDLRNTKGNRIRTPIGFGVSKAVKRLKRQKEQHEDRLLPGQRSQGP